MMASKEDYRYPGGYTFAGITYSASVSPDVLQKIKQDLEFDPSDVVIATYSKSGEKSVF